MRSLSISHCFWVAAVITFYCNLINFLRPFSPPASFHSSTMTTGSTLLFSGTQARRETFTTVVFSLLRVVHWKPLIWHYTPVIETRSIGSIPTKAKDPNLTMKHSYPPLCVNQSTLCLRHSQAFPAIVSSKYIKFVRLIKSWIPLIYIYWKQDWCFFCLAGWVISIKSNHFRDFLKTSWFSKILSFK